MSRAHARTESPQNGFPRVNGDEPVNTPTSSTHWAFSPRERGLSPRGMRLWGHCANFLFELMENAICCCK
mgnify:CR=1 FL=1